MSRPLLLDLFCGQGGAAKGYHDAGFDVIGVDIENHEVAYPFAFIQYDAMEFMRAFDDWDLPGLAAIHASPPCQAFSLASLWHGKEKAAEHPDLVDETRDLLNATGLPWVMENVEGSPLRRDLVLCGEMFGLRVHRHRVFELGGWFAMQPRHAPHRLKGALHNCHIEEGHARLVAGHFKNQVDAGDAMGIGWMTRAGLAQAIPPAYTEFIGSQLLLHVLLPSKTIDAGRQAA